MNDVEKISAELNLTEKTKIRNDKNFVRDIKEFCAGLIKQKETYQEACQRHDDNYTKDFSELSRLKVKALGLCQQLIKREDLKAKPYVGLICPYVKLLEVIKKSDSSENIEEIIEELEYEIENA